MLGRICFLLFLTLVVAGADQAAFQAGPVESTKSLEAAWQVRQDLAAGRWDQARRGLNALMTGSRKASDYERAFSARVLAEGATRFLSRDSNFSTSLSQAAERRLKPFLAWLEDYPKLVEVIDLKEPLWIRGQAEVVAEVILAYAHLERLDGSQRHLQAIERFATGLAALDRKDPSRFPFRAHTSFARLSPGYVPLGDGRQTGGLYWVTERATQIQALVAASELLEQPALLVSAEREALGMGAHLAVSGKLPRAFTPRPVEGGGERAGITLVENLQAVYRLSGKRVYAVLAGLVASRLESGSALVSQAVKVTPALGYRSAVDRVRPSTYQVMDAENGRAVKKAFDSSAVIYPGGQTGQVVTVGREQMFWMRFDVDREDEYFFYLVFLKSDIGGGLVSVMMRIDGDKIFQVNLGGAGEVPFMDIELVEGPRPLRQGPHSFGLRFSGLLMTRPAVLDAIMVQPVVERRTVELSDGRRLIVLKNLSPEPAPTGFEEVQPWPPERLDAWDGEGQPVELKYTSDRRRRKDYLLVPAGGVVALEWRPAKGGSDGTRSSRYRVE